MKQISKQKSQRKDSLGFKGMKFLNPAEMSAHLGGMHEMVEAPKEKELICQFPIGKIIQCVTMEAACQPSSAFTYNCSSLSKFSTSCSSGGDFALRPR